MSFEASLAESTPAESTSNETQATPETVAPGTPTDVEQGGQRQSESVPYSRFHEVNTQLSTLNQRAKDAGYSNASEYLQALESYTSAQDAYEEPDGETDPIQIIEQRLNQQSEILAEQLFTTQFAQMKAQFPQAEAEEVKRALVYGEAKNLQAAMKGNHERNEAKRQAAIADYNRTQQQRQTAAVEGAGGGSSPGGVDYANMTRDQRRKMADDIVSRRIAPPG